MTNKAPMSAVFLDAQTLQLDSLNTTILDTLHVALTCYQTTAPNEIVPRIANTDIVLVNKVVLDSNVLRQAKQLKYIGVTATGMNNVDVEYCDAHGICVKNVEAYGTDSVAQHTLMLLLNLATSFAQYQRDVNEGMWSRTQNFCLIDHPIIELAGKHAVIVGYGELGKRVAALFTALGMKVSIAARPGSTNDSRPSLTSLLPTADVVSLHCPLTDDNYHLFNDERLSLMKKGSFLINTARGGLIDENALLRALKSGHLGGAALDVVSVEPPPDTLPLLNANLPNLIITPHIAWMAKESRQRLFNIAIGHLQEFVQNQLPS